MDRVYDSALGARNLTNQVARSLLESGVIRPNYTLGSEEPGFPILMVKLLAQEINITSGVYGQSKAAGDAVAATAPRHYIVRTSWVIGEGNNFVRTMASLAERGIAPGVVNDQIGRLSFTEDIAAGIKHLLDSGADYGVYNLSNDGEPQSWADIAADVYELTGHNRQAVTGVSTEDYFKGKDAAPRPLNSTLNLDKIKATGFTPATAAQRLAEYFTS